MYASRVSNPVNSNVSVSRFQYEVTEVPMTTARIRSASPSGKSAVSPPCGSYLTKHRANKSPSGSPILTAAEVNMTPRFRSFSPKLTTMSLPGWCTPFKSRVGGSLIGNTSINTADGALSIPKASTTTNSTPLTAPSGFLPLCTYVTFRNASRSACVDGASFASNVLSPRKRGALKVKTPAASSISQNTRPRHINGSAAVCVTANTSTPGPTFPRSEATCACAVA
mmetsp:Transcript_5787/g.21889  ORF Transcript_5787/g.21889 Transcript_5787/m.21889 type:complete len:225 (-) Transcript_5787:404-1078(-)